MRPEVSYCEPWQGQNQPPYSPRGSVGFWPSGTQPRWVQTPTMISHSGLLRRAAASVCGSRSSAMLTASASLISSGVRWRDEDRLAAPDHRDRLADLDLGRCRPRWRRAPACRPTGSSGRSRARRCEATPTAPTATGGQDRGNRAGFRRHARRPCAAPVRPCPSSLFSSATPRRPLLIASATIRPIAAGFCDKPTQNAANRADSLRPTATCGRDIPPRRAV